MLLYRVWLLHSLLSSPYFTPNDHFTTPEIGSGTVDAYQM